MPWCPNCKTEYREGFKECSDCGAELVEELPDTEEHYENDEKQVLLKNVENDFEADIVQSLLKSNGIESIRIHKGAGDFLKVYMGSSELGVDIYVLESDLEAAKELLEAKADESAEVSDNEQVESDEVQYAEESSEEYVSEDGNRVFVKRVTAWILISILLLFAMPSSVLLAFLILILLFLVISHFSKK